MQLSPASLCPSHFPQTEERRDQGEFASSDVLLSQPTLSWKVSFIWRSFVSTHFVLEIPSFRPGRFPLSGVLCFNSSCLGTFLSFNILASHSRIDSLGEHRRIYEAHTPKYSETSCASNLNDYFSTVTISSSTDSLRYFNHPLWPSFSEKEMCYYFLDGEKGCDCHEDTCPRSGEHQRKTPIEWRKRPPPRRTRKPQTPRSLSPQSPDPERDLTLGKKK